VSKLRENDRLLIFVKITCNLVKNHKVIIFEVEGQYNISLNAEGFTLSLIHRPFYWINLTIRKVIRNNVVN